MMSASEQSQTQDKKQKTHDEYSRNVKKLKYKLQKVRQQILGYEKKLHKLSNTSNDQIIAMKISKFCKQRSIFTGNVELTPEMLFRFADSKCMNIVTRMEFRNTLVGIGLRLSQEELTRLEYLLDEDIKGDVSLLEYSKYLHAFGLKTEHDPNDPFVKQTLKDIDFNKLLEMAKEDKKQKKGQGERVLLTYEQFLKYCHKHFPQIKDKQLAKIFQKLKHNQKIDLDDLIDYLMNLMKQKKRIEDKNSAKKKKQQQEEQDRKKMKKKLTAEEQEQMIDITTLKGKLMAVMKDHSQKQQTFHSSEFRRVETNYKLEKGSMLALFREMDVGLVGSIGFNDIIGFYVEKETYKPHNDPNNSLSVKYSFVLMGKKLLAVGEKPQALLAAFAKEDNFITLQQFSKMCQVEFGLKKELAVQLYQVMLQCQKTKQNGFTSPPLVKTSLLISLMKINRPGVKNTVRPVLQQQYKQYFYKKHHQTICTNGIVAYKICQSIVGQLALAEKYQKWNDFQFGPSPQDQLGLDAIGTHIANPNVKWHRASALGMTQFYIPPNKQQSLYSLSSMCPHDLFHKSLQTLVKQDEKFVYRTTNQIIKHNKKVEESQLLKLFEGVYPLAFHRFRQRGIYVIQFFTKGKWVYVIVDDKIPCNQQDELMFARSQNGAMVPIVEKAYAKLKGAYEKLFEYPGMSKYFNELAGKLLIVKAIDQKAEGGELQKWMMGSCGMEVRKKQVGKKRQLKGTYSEVFLANLTLQEKKLRQQQKKDLAENSLMQIFFFTQIKDPQQPNPYHLTLISCRSQYANNQGFKKWSPSQSLYRKQQQLIKAQVNKWDSQSDTTKIFRNGKLEALIIDSETIKNEWNSIVEMMSFRFDDEGVLLRKELEFEREFGCVYKVNSTDKANNVRLVMVVNRIRAPDDAKVIVTLKPTTISKQQNSSQPQPFITHTLKHQFSCLSFSIPQHQHQLQLKIQKQKFDPQQQYVYQLSFYFDHPRYSLKQRDRHLLFRYVSQYEERSRLEFDWLTEGEKRYFYENFFLNANRKGFLCC